MQLLINLDVPGLAAAEALYTAAFDLRAGRRLGQDAVELLGAPVAIFLLAKPATRDAAPGAHRDYGRHWMPCHLDVTVDNIDIALARAEAAGFVREGAIRNETWGRIVQLADPFGHGWCLLQFTKAGYDAIATQTPPAS